jgi:DNA-binding TFAR19-related protein (PDSD5 family)
MEDCMVEKPASYAEYGLKVRIAKLRANTTSYVKKLRRLSQEAPNEAMKQLYLKRANYAAELEAKMESELRERLNAIRMSNPERH